MVRKRKTVGSLFAGIGGFDLGLERAGWTTQWQVEIDSQCQDVLRRHFTDATRYEDVTDVGPALVPVDLICGGFPCQDLSVAGRREGLAGERSGLFFEFMRVVDEVAPRWVLIENVPGLLSSNDGRDMGTVLATLADLGYGWSYRVLDTQYFGPPQRRRRVFIVGHSGGPCPPEILFEPESLPWHPAPSREAGEGAARGVEGGAGNPGGGVRDVRHSATITPTLNASGAGTSRPGGPRLGSEEDYVVVGGRNSVLPFDTTQITSKGNYSRPKPGDPCHPLARGAHPPSVAPMTFQDRTRGTEVEHGDGRLVGSLRAGDGGSSRSRKLIDQRSVPRRLTPTECERLQGFPDDWTAWGVDEDGERVEMADTPRYRMLGNAVSVPVAGWIGRRIIAAHESAEAA